jgi:hypothetical protein
MKGPRPDDVIPNEFKVGDVVPAFVNYVSFIPSFGCKLTKLLSCSSFVPGWMAQQAWDTVGRVAADKRACQAQVKEFWLCPSSARPSTDRRQVSCGHPWFCHPGLPGVLRRFKTALYPRPNGELSLVMSLWETLWNPVMQSCKHYQ